MVEREAEPGDNEYVSFEGKRSARRATTPVVACVLLIGAVLAGCGDLTSSPAAGTFTPRTPGVLTVVTSTLPSPGFWEGTASHPTGGLEYQLARDLADRFGLKSVRIKVEHFNRIVRGQLNGADLALDLITPTAQREQSLDFSSPYLDAAATVLVRSGQPVSDLDTAQSLRWGAIRGTTFVGIINSLITPDQPVQLFENSPAMLDALESNRIDAVLFDMPLAVLTARRSGGRLEAVAQLPNPESIAAALPKGSSNVQAVDSAMQAFTNDGRMDHLLKVWVGSAAANAESSIPLLHTLR